MQLEDYFDFLAPDDIRNMSMGDTIEELILIAATSKDDEYQDSIRYMPIT